MTVTANKLGCYGGESALLTDEQTYVEWRREEARGEKVLAGSGRVKPDDYGAPRRFCLNLLSVQGVRCTVGCFCFLCAHQPDSTTEGSFLLHLLVALSHLRPRIVYTLDHNEHARSCRRASARGGKAPLHMYFI